VAPDIPTEPDDETLPDAFWGVARRLRELTRESLAPWDISPSHWRALRALARHGEIRLSELSEHLRIAPRSATEVVDALEARGLVERRPDPTDRRATLIIRTPAAEELSEAIKASRRGEEERFFGSLNAADRAHLARILRKLR
jgi:DNA-binding MarR family transcriptional regulator